MEAPYITLHTTTLNSFRHTDGYKGASVTDLEILFQQSCKITTLLEGELMKRQHKRSLNQPGELGKCCKRLYNTVRAISVKERLEGKAVKQVEDAVEILTAPQTASLSKTY